MKKTFGILATILAVAAGLVGTAEAAAIGNPNPDNGWSSASAAALGNPSPMNGWNTTSAVSIRAFSSEKATRPWIKTIDGSGLDAAAGRLHDISYTNIGYSGLADENVPRGGTVAGYVWVEYDLGDVHELGEMWIWNCNELNFPHFGMNEVTIQYSATGGVNPAEWATIYDDYIPLAAGAGLSPSPVDLIVDFNGAAARYIVITTDDPPFHNHRPEYQEVALSEVRFHLTAAVKVSASSQHPTRGPHNVINGSGIDPEGVGDGGLHSNVFSDMWLSDNLAASAARRNGGTVRGSHWIRFDFDQSYDLAQMWIWNYNELNVPTMGMKDVTVEYSNIEDPNDPWEWETAFVGTIPMAGGGGLGPSGVDLKVDFGGVPVRHVVITAVDDIHKNWSYDDPNEVYWEEVGLSEVRFFTVPQTCAEAIADGYALAADGDGDCYVNVRDFALLAQNWLMCMDPEDEDCVMPWE